MTNKFKIFLDIIDFSVNIRAKKTKVGIKIQLLKMKLMPVSDETEDVYERFYACIKNCLGKNQAC